MWWGWWVGASWKLAWSGRLVVWLGIIADAFRTNTSICFFTFEKNGDQESFDTNGTLRKVEFYTKRNRINTLAALTDDVVWKQLSSRLLHKVGQSQDEVGPSLVYYTLRKDLDMVPPRASRKRPQVKAAETD